MSRIASPHQWMRHIRGADLKSEDETKAKSLQKLSKKITATHLQSEPSLSEDLKRVISTFFALTYPSLPPVHTRILIQEMHVFLEASIDQEKIERILAEMRKGRALPAFIYFRDWMATQADDTHELRCAVEALKRAVKDTISHRHSSCLDFPS